MGDLDAAAQLDALNADPRVATIARLATLGPVAYAACRKTEATALGIGVRDLDVARRAEMERRAAAAREHHRRLPPPVPDEVRWPAGYTMKADGLYGPEKGDNPPPWLAAHFEVLGHARNDAGEEWGTLLRWHDLDRGEHRFTVQAAMTVSEPGKLEAELARRGLRLSTDPGPRFLLRRALSEVQTGNRVRVVYATGWHGTNDDLAFLLPNGEMLGARCEGLVLDRVPHDAKTRCTVAGTDVEWRESVAALAEGNPLAMFCICVGLTGPLFRSVGESGGGFHVCGPSKIGKTLAMQMGVSAWALPEKAGGGLRDWRSTANGLEATAEEFTDALLPLDELHQANPAEVAGAAYMIADGAGKARLKSDASAARRRTWRACILSTGEYDLATAVGRIGQSLPAGADVRLPSIHVGAVSAIWPNLHGRPDFQTLAADIHKAMKLQHGASGRRFIECLMDDLATPSQPCLTDIDAVRQRFTGTLPAGADPQVRHVCQRFGLAAAAGELAIAWGILAWPAGSAERAGGAMFALWLRQRDAGTGASEEAAQLAQVRRVLIEHGGSRFTELIPQTSGGWCEATPLRPVSNRIGWWRNAPGRSEYLIPAETWRGTVCAPAGIDPTAAARTLAKRRFLRRGEGKNLMVKDRIPGLSSAMRVYAVQASLLDEPGGKEAAHAGPT
jgi:hypothetical protein